MLGVCVFGAKAPPNNESLDIWVIFHNLNKCFVILYEAEWPGNSRVWYFSADGGRPYYKKACGRWLDANH